MLAKARARPWVIDAGAAALITIFMVAATRHIPGDSGNRPLDALGYAAIVLAGMSLAACRRWPEGAVGAVSLALAAYLFRRYPGGPIYLTGWVALGALGWRRSRKLGLIGAAAFCAVLLTAALIQGEISPILHLVFVGWSLAAVLAGDALRTRRERLSQLEQRARDLERTREEEARRLVAEDRLRIARDLHDSVAHAMATINVQAGAAAHVVDRRPEAAKEALGAIQRASGEVLDELAALLGLLREPGEAADRAPTPGIDQIPTLVASTKDARLAVTVAITGPVGKVTAPVGTAAYRIVQESLTNVIRHAGGAATTVTVAADGGGGLTVEVVDAGPVGANGSTPPPPTARTGMGLRGMRERAEATGGSFAAGPGPAGGFLVRATWAAPVAPA